MQLPDQIPAFVSDGGWPEIASELVMVVVLVALTWAIIGRRF